MAPEPARGLYRESASQRPDNWARVRYAGQQEMDVPRDRYISQGYLPEFDELPTKHDYLNQQARGGKG
jgi:hypothetical protein